jgi:serine/threonine protein kinase
VVIDDAGALSRPDCMLDPTMCMVDPTPACPTTTAVPRCYRCRVGERRGQLDALLDVDLVLANTEPDASDRSPTPSNEVIGRNSAADLEVGTQLGKYKLVQLLGSGGMGAVWEGHDTELDRRIALKVLRRDYEMDGTARSRLMREARAMARLDHPNVIKVFDAFVFEGRDVIAMELVQGETLASWLARSHPRTSRVAMLIAAGRGLSAAHAAGLVHRDFKPYNVLVDQRDRVLVTDFGLARASGEVTPADRAPAAAAKDVAVTKPDRPAAGTTPSPARTLGALDSSLTLPGTVLGTPAYMAPEQLRGSAADEKSDQFSYCVTFWEAITGQRPFPGDTLPDIVAAVDSGTPRHAEGVPRRLRAILSRGLAWDPAQRWPSMNPLLDAIVRAWHQPRRIALGLGAFALVVIAAAAVLYTVRDQRDVTWRPKIVDLPAFEENSSGLAISPDGTRIAYDSDREHSDLFRVYVSPMSSGDARALTPADKNFYTPRWKRDGSGLLVATWDPEAVGYRVALQPLDGSPARDLGTGIHADDCGDAIAVADFTQAQATLSLLYPDGRRQVLVTVSREYIVSPRCDSSGQRILYARGVTPNLTPPIADLYIVDRAGRQQQLTSGHIAAAGVFTPDGRSVVFSGMMEAKVNLFEVSTTTGKIHQLTFDNGPHLNPDVSPDGRTVVFDRDLTSRIAVAGGEGAPRKLGGRHETLDWLVPPGPDGKELVAQRLGPGGTDVVAISTHDGSDRLLAPGGHPFRARDGRIWFVGRDSKRVQAIDLATGTIEVIVDLPAPIAIAADGNDGVHFELTRDGRPEWWLFRNGKLEAEPVDGLAIEAPHGGWRAMRRFEQGFRYKLVAPNGKPTGVEIKAESMMPTWLDDHRFAYAEGGAFHIIDVTTGAEVGSMPGPQWGAVAVLSTDGVHWWDLVVAGHVTRHQLANFADRPWR